MRLSKRTPERSWRSSYFRGVLVVWIVGCSGRTLGRIECPQACSVEFPKPHDYPEHLDHEALNLQGILGWTLGLDPRI